MDEKYAWPLVGVVLGWALTALVTTLKDRAESRRRIGVLISKLLVVHEQLETLRFVSEKFKDFLGSWESYEPMRKGISDRHFLEPSSHIDSLREAIDDVAGIYPVEARALHGLIDMLEKNKRASLSGTVRNRDLYIKFLSVYEVGLDASSGRLKTDLRRFAWRHGAITYWLVRRQLKSRDRISKVNLEFFDKFGSESFAEVQKMLNEAKEAKRTMETAPSEKAPAPTAPEGGGAV